MKITQLRFGARYLLFQRNILLVFSSLLSVALVVLSLLLFFRQERIVVVPPVVDKAFWVEQGAVSATYLEQYASFLAQLLLGKSESSAASNREIILRHTEPSFTGVLQKRLKEEEATLQKQHVAYVFYPELVDASPKSLQVTFWGERVIYAQDKRLSSTKEGYVLGFSYQSGRLLLKSLEKKEERGESNL